MEENSKIIDGKKLALERELILKKKVARLKIKPKIVSILIGCDPSSLLYSRIKKAKAQEIGINFELLKFPASISFKKLSQVINKLNSDPTVDGIMVQLPLPGKFDTDEMTDKVVSLIFDYKDVDGLTNKGPVPQATVKAVLTILESYHIVVKDKKVGVVGVTGMVGGPLAESLKKMGAEILGFNSKTPNLNESASQVDILISCANKPDLINKDAVKEGAVVIDVGMNVNFNEVKDKASLITPPTGGVGPVTVISLMENAVDLVQLRVSHFLSS